MCIPETEQKILASLDNSWRGVRDLWRRAQKPIRSELMMRELQRLAAAGKIELHQEPIIGTSRRGRGARTRDRVVETFRMMQI